MQRRPQPFVCETREMRETITAASIRARVYRININIYVCVINRRPVYERDTGRRSRRAPSRIIISRENEVIRETM